MKNFEFLPREKLLEYQLRLLNETLSMAGEKSRFYAERLAGYFENGRARLSSIDELTSLPFTYADDLSAGMENFICEPPGRISRIVSLPTSGSTGPSKRIAFSKSDLDATVEYFSYGMSQMVASGDKVMICLPGRSDYGVAHLLSIGLEGFGAEPVVYGAVSDLDDAVARLSDVRPDCVVGMPVQVLMMAERFDAAARFHDRPNPPATVLLSADHAADGLKRRIAGIWDCEVFDHYGSTETGYGCALECGRHEGLHLRETDMCFEVVDPSGKPLPPGKEGELVFTTLTRRGMPLVRYRTGDVTSFIEGPCECGRTLRRITPPKRVRGATFRAGGKTFFLSELDDVVFRDRHVLDYRAEVTDGELTSLRVWTSSGGFDPCRLNDALTRALPVTKIDISIAAAGEISPGLKGKRTLET
jgi:phenylacetate-coenzyme A ligase PaaK-like adenylate-forming protein